VHATAAETSLIPSKPTRETYLLAPTPSPCRLTSHRVASLAAHGCVAGVSVCENGRLQSWVDGFGFQGEDGEDRFVDAPEWFAAGCAFEGFEAEGVLA
jgi:hypothetical protein